MTDNEITPPEIEREPSATPRSPLPMAAIVAIVIFAIGGLVLLGLAAMSLRAEAAAEATKTRTPTSTPPVVTPVPTIIPSETPTPTETATTTPTETASPSPTVPVTPSRTPKATKKPASGGGAPPAPPTATAPPAPTQPPSSASGGGSHGLTGQLSLCNPKSSYAVAAENLSGGANGFQTSWRGDLSVPAHGNGPTGGGWQDGLYLEPGTYSLTLSICYSDVNTCLGQSGNWETLTPGIIVNVVNWTP